MTVDTSHPKSIQRLRPIGVRPRSFQMKHGLIAFIVCFLVIFLLIPLLLIFSLAFANGIATFIRSITEADGLKALFLTLRIAAIVVPLNLLFGLAAAWAVTKHQFRGKRILVSLIDLPFSVPPVVVGVIYILIFGRNGWAWSLIEPGWHVSLPLIGIVTLRLPHIVFAQPGIVLTTLFVTLPLIARELMPLMERQGLSDELVAISLGATGWNIFWRVTLPNIRWALLSGSLLCAARALGEFGAVSVVSGHIRGRTNTMPLHIEILYNDYAITAAFAYASVLALSALFTLLLKSFLQWRHSRYLTAARATD